MDLLSGLALGEKQDTEDEFAVGDDDGFDVQGVMYKGSGAH